MRSLLLTEAGLDDATDRMNPILVKELRQGLRAKVFLGGFGLLLFACTAIALAVWAAAPTSGSDVFLSFFGLYVAITCFVVPFTAHRSLARELSDETWPSLALTPLKARQIVRGKILGSLSQSVLFASLVAPFLFFSYSLTGIGLATIFACMGLSFIVQPAITTVAVCSATLVDRRATQGIAMLGTLTVLVVATWTTIALASDFARNPVFSLSALKTLFFFVFFAVTGGAILFEVAAAQLASTAENTAIGPRIAIIAHLVLHLASTALSDSGDHERALFVLVDGSLLMFAIGVHGLGGPAAPPRALRSERGWRAPLVPGALRALRFSVVGGIVVSGLALVVGGLDDPDFWAPHLSLPASLAIFLSLAAIIGKGLFPGTFSDSTRQRALALGLMVVGILLPLLVASTLPREPFDAAWNLFNPFAALVISMGRMSGHETLWRPLLVVVVPVSIALTIVADRILAARERRALVTEAGR